MLWLVAIFVPAHKRGMITMGPREADSCCAPVVKPVTCCDEEVVETHDPTSSDEPEKKDHEPTQRDIANCAVCYWCAIVLPIEVTTIDLSPSGIVASTNFYSDSALIKAILIHDALPRGPPALL